VRFFSLLAKNNSARKPVEVYTLNMCVYASENVLNAEV